MPRWTLVIAVVSVTALARLAGAADEVRLTIAQALASLPTVTVFLDLANAKGEASSAPDAAAITATLGEHRATVEGVTPFESTGDGTAYIFMVDVSQSMSAADMSRVREAMSGWLAASREADRFALLAFGDDVTTAVDFTADREVFQRAAESLSPQARTTQLHTAIQRAIELSRRQDEGLPARRVAVLLSDGQDEGSGLTADDLAAQLRQERLAVYAIGYSRLRGAARAQGFDALLRFARNSGGQFTEAARSDLARDAGRGLPDAYAAMQRAVMRVFAVTLRCDECPGDGQLHRLQVEVKTGDRVLSDGIDVRLPPKPASRHYRGALDPADEEQAKREAQANWASSQRLWVVIALGLVMLASTATWLVVRRRQQHRGAPPTPAAALTPAAGSSGAFANGAPVVGAQGIALTFHFRGRRAPDPITVTLRDHLIVGTDAACAIVIPDDTDVAEAHCELAWEAGHVTLRRLDGTLPTLVNGAALAPTSRYRLEHGDVLLVGNTELRLMFGEAL